MSDERSHELVVKKKLLIVVAKHLNYFATEITSFYNKLISCINSFLRKIDGKVCKISRLKKIGFRKRLYMYLAIILIFILVLSISFIKSSSGPNKTYANLLKINAVQSELSKLEMKVSSASHLNINQEVSIENKLKNINSAISKVSLSNGSGSIRNIKSLKATIESTKVGLSEKIKALNNEIESIKKEIHPPKTLNPKVLPFVVDNIDTWNGKPFVQIHQKNNMTMNAYLGLYQRSGRWKVVSLDAPEQQVQFINDEGQLVSVKVKDF